MDVSSKLQIKPGQAVAVLRLPSSVSIELPSSSVSATDSETADAVIVFVQNRAELDAYGQAAVAAASRDALSWIAYPKAGQLATDLNRDRLAAAVHEHGVRAVRQVSIDEVWSALRLRPG